MNEMEIHYEATVNAAHDKLEWAKQHGTERQIRMAEAELENARNAPGKPSSEEAEQ